MRTYDAAPSSERPYLRFAFSIRGMTFLGREVVAPEFLILDAEPSTYPSGFIEGQGYLQPRVLELKNGKLKFTNVQFEPDLNEAHATPAT